MNIPLEIKSWTVERRREFHRYPEPSWHEVKTAARIEQILGELGIETRRVAGTGVIGQLRGGQPGKTVGLRADIDGLQQHEETGLPFASENPGFMHACGHDAHIAMLLGAAKLLAERASSLPGRVLFLFQPAEELCQGAKAMIEAGALEGVHAVFGIHVWSALPAGKVSIEPGPRMASADIFKITFKGKGGHGSAPQEGVDTIVPAALTVLGLQSIVCKELDARKPVVLNVGQIHGGTRFNVIADETTIDGSVRCFDPEVQDLIEEKVRRVARLTAEAHRATVELEYSRACPVTVNDPGLTELAQRVARRELGEACLACLEPVTGSEDFSFYASKVPATYAFLGVGNKAKGTTYPQHHPCYDIDEDVLEYGVKLHVAFAEAFLRGENSV
ncbi:MAG TPA: amidohydrolase [Firmicutes bacterium]|nr:amidohydrolase [Bacillota bacterium]